MERLPGELVAAIWGMAGLAPRGPTRAMHAAIRVDWFSVYVQQLLHSHDYEGTIHLLQHAVQSDDADLLKFVLCVGRYWTSGWKRFSLARASCARGHIKTLRALLDIYGTGCMQDTLNTIEPAEDMFPRKMAKAELAMCTTRSTLVWNATEYHVIGCVVRRRDHATADMLARDYNVRLNFADLLQTIEAGDEQGVEFIMQHLPPIREEDAIYAFDAACTSGNVTLCHRFAPDGEFPIPDYRTRIADGWMSSTHMLIVKAGHVHLISKEFGFPGGGTTAPFFKILLTSKNVAQRADAFLRAARTWNIRPGALSRREVRKYMEDVRWCHKHGHRAMADLIEYVISRGRGH